MNVNDIKRLDVSFQPLTKANRNLKEDRGSGIIPPRCIWRYDRRAALHRQCTVVAIIIGRNSRDFDAAPRQRTFDIDHGAAWSTMDGGNGWNDVEYLHETAAIYAISLATIRRNRPESHQISRNPK